MDRFSILLKKSCRKPVTEPKVKDENNQGDPRPRPTVRIEIPDRTNPNRRVSAAYYSDYDRRPENVSIQTLHPNDGDLIIFSVPRAHADDLNMFQDVLEAKIRELGVQCQVMVCNY